MNLFETILGANNNQRGFQGGFARAVPQKFERIFQAMPMSFALQKEDTRQVDSGNKILMPPSALDTLSRMNIQYPMMFRIANTAKINGKQRFSHCSVLEFTAPEGKVYLPLSMIHNLNLDVNGTGYVELKNVSLQKGSFARFQPFKYEFVTDIPNHKVVLEKTLRNYACLTKGDVIEIKFLDKCHDLEVVELKPANVVSIIETDMSVEFAEPKDGKAPSYSQPASHAPAKVESSDSEDEDEFGSARKTRVLPSLKKQNSASATGYRLKDGKKQDSPEAAKKTSDTGKSRIEEEVVGNYRFIYRVNEDTGERKCIRRLPNRGGPAFGGSGRSLKN